MAKITLGTKRFVTNAMDWCNKTGGQVVGGTCSSSKKKTKTVTKKKKK